MHRQFSFFRRPFARHLALAVCLLSLALGVLPAPTATATVRAYALPSVTLSSSAATQLVATSTPAITIVVSLDREASGYCYLGRADVSEEKCLKKLAPGETFVVAVPDYAARVGERMNCSEYYVLGTANGDLVAIGYVIQS